MYNEIIRLVSISEGENLDEYGDREIVEGFQEVFAEVKSIGMREFYQAQTAGMKPEIVFEIADYFDYNNQTFVEYEGVRYKVLRTYRKGVPLEIVCYGGVRIGST